MYVRALCVLSLLYCQCHVLTLGRRLTFSRHLSNSWAFRSRTLSFAPILDVAPRISIHSRFHQTASVSMETLVYWQVGGAQFGRHAFTTRLLSRNPGSSNNFSKLQRCMG
ncbi:hypothetical protein K438DRAFT_545776 [Mycena galopus ATCC 62051]|nr:hypothetical protein K438DRAFT_545776 [Mycena galopus ATCC 62051]